MGMCTQHTAAPLLSGTPDTMNVLLRAMEVPNPMQGGCESTGRNVKLGSYTPVVALSVQPNTTPVSDACGDATMIQVSKIATCVPKPSPSVGAPGACNLIITRTQRCPPEGGKCVSLFLDDTRCTVLLTTSIWMKSHVPKLLRRYTNAAPCGRGYKQQTTVSTAAHQQVTSVPSRHRANELGR